jgi:phosphatidylserine/phosphatidylglycerophosphate/cardiolipin synthase-like enzyme
VIVIKDLLGAAELYRSEKLSAVSDTIKKLDDIQIKRNWADGWFALGDSGKSRFTTDNELEILIDNKIELESVVQSINHSTSYVYLSQIEFNADFVATFKSEDDTEIYPKDALTDVLKKADERGVKVKIILNENLVVPDSTSEIEDYFKSSGVEVREFKSNGLHVMHAKILIVDGREAYVIGSPFIQEFWDIINI